VLCHFYDREGKLVDHSVNDRVMSIPIPTLRKVPRRVIASGGSEKVEALLGAMKLIDCNALITTETTAQELLIRKK
jgi:DNA-binding transcriptional regulator LsrR (DeoR family)